MKTETKSIEADLTAAATKDVQTALPSQADAVAVLAEMVKQKCFACDCGISDELWDRAAAIGKASP